MFSEDASKKVASTMFNAAVCGCKSGGLQISSANMANVTCINLATS